MSIRSYSLEQDTHAHAYHQIVIPLAGAMDIRIAEARYNVATGHCIVIPSVTLHLYSAPEKSRFLVADMAALPPNASGLNDPCVAINESLMSFCAYAEVQLTSVSDEATAGLLFDLFRHLLVEEP